ncbi:hypothetical protein [Massilia sp. TWP1-3-3]|uniref:hypothetical protein n=1 Tax=Massilia sp. TWP1-3-3 TaxID=2804573 RepID=UPI003CED876F
MFAKRYIGLAGTSAALAALIITPGCASIVSGTSQIISVETLSDAGKVDGASCKLQNDKGVYFVTTPGTVTVRRAYGDMNVKCEKAGFPTGMASVKSKTKGMMAGNIIFGGVIGVGVDAASGAAYDYPVLLQIKMNDAVANSVLPPSTSAAPSAAPAQAASADMVNGVPMK